MTALTEMFKRREPARLTTPEGQVGEPRFVTCHGDWMGTAYNAGVDSGQVSRIVFAGTLLPGAKVWLNFKNSDCSDVSIELHNCNAASGANAPLGQLLVDKINGAIIPGAITISPVTGFTAALINATTVDITGAAGNRFTIVPTGFGVTIGIAR